MSSKYSACENCAKLKDSNASLQIELDAIQKELVSVKNFSSSSETKVIELQKKCDEYKNLCDEIHKKILELTQAIDRKAEYIKSTTEKFATLKKAFNAQSETINDLNRQMKEREACIEELKRALQESQKFSQGTNAQLETKDSGRSRNAAGGKVLANNQDEAEVPGDTDVKDSISTAASKITENCEKVTRKGKQVEPVAKKPHGDDVLVVNIEMDEAGVPLKSEMQKHKEEEILEEKLTDGKSKVTKPAPRRGKKKTLVKAKKQDSIPENSEDGIVVKNEVYEDCDVQNKNLKRQGTKIEVTDTNSEETFIVPKKSKKGKNQHVKEPEPEGSITVSNAKDLNCTFLIEKKPKEKTVTDSESKPPAESDTKPIEASASRQTVKPEPAKLTPGSPRVTRSRRTGDALKRPLPTQKAKPIKSVKRRQTKENQHSE